MAVFRQPSRNSLLNNSIFKQGDVKFFLQVQTKGRMLMTNVSKLDETTFNLSDFALFLSVMKNKEAYESTLSIITNDHGLKLKEVHVEQVILNKLGKRAIRLDAWASDSENRQYNMEMQNDTDNDDIKKRSRYYQGLIDSPVLKSGKQTKYRHLPATMIIFITQDDIFGNDSAIYTFTEQCKEFPAEQSKYHFKR